MANSKLLKEAIADAKAVKETALANAKLALEEAFTPRLQSILSQKLRAEAEEEKIEFKVRDIPEGALSFHALLTHHILDDMRNVPGLLNSAVDYVKERKVNTDKYDLINPRRKGQFETWGDIAAEQIAWEHDALIRCDAVLFWFPKDTLCPITLFELGKQLAYVGQEHVVRPLIIGWDPEYARAFDLEQQILEAWKVTDDIRTVLDHGAEEDMVENFKALARLSDIRFEKLWYIFEQMCASRQFVDRPVDSEGGETD